MTETGNRLGYEFVMGVPSGYLLVTLAVSGGRASALFASRRWRRGLFLNFLFSKKCLSTSLVNVDLRKQADPKHHGDLLQVASQHGGYLTRAACPPLPRQLPGHMRLRRRRAGRRHHRGFGEFSRRAYVHDVLPIHGAPLFQSMAAAHTLVQQHAVHVRVRRRRRARGLRTHAAVCASERRAHRAALGGAFSTSSTIPSHSAGMSSQHPRDLDTTVHHAHARVPLRAHATCTAHAPRRALLHCEQSAFSTQLGGTCSLAVSRKLCTKRVVACGRGSTVAVRFLHVSCAQANDVEVWDHSHESSSHPHGHFCF